MTASDDYVNRVLDRMPRDMPRRDQIGAELRSHIAARVATGQPLEDVLAQLGDPVALADSYLAEVPLVPAPLGRRLAAKLVDLCLLVAAAAILWSPLIGLGAVRERFELVWLGIVLTLLLCSILFAFYTIVAEWQFGQTVGKRMLHLQVVQESGAQIGLGQSIVRQLPAFLQVFWIDAMFALFTDKRQRAFEMLSKTRVILLHE
jgi:uncharacterized RDD family membrane protein YckC